ncbi:hypothetical protein ACFU53_46420, partial [Streptomyces sp. NPDC057474]
MGDVASGDIRAALRPGQLRELVVRDSRIQRDLVFLSGRGGLAHVDVSGGTPYVDDLTPLTGIPLARLSLVSLPGLEKPGALHVLSASTTLTDLDLGFVLCAESVDEALPRNLPLKYLRFIRDALRHTGLRGLSHMPSVKRLSLAKLPKFLVRPRTSRRSPGFSPWRNCVSSGTRPVGKRDRCCRGSLVHGSTGSPATRTCRRSRNSFRTFAKKGAA